MYLICLRTVILKMRLQLKVFGLISDRTCKIKIAWSLCCTKITFLCINRIKIKNTLTKQKKTLLCNVTVSYLQIFWHMDDNLSYFTCISNMCDRTCVELAQSALPFIVMYTRALYIKQYTPIYWIHWILLNFQITGGIEVG